MEACRSLMLRHVHPGELVGRSSVNPLRTVADLVSRGLMCPGITMLLLAASGTCSSSRGTMQQPQRMLDAPTCVCTCACVCAQSVQLRLAPRAGFNPKDRLL